jgi:hypothetical protein
MGTITDSLERAFDRIDDFQAVQAASSTEELDEAVLRLQAAVGIRDEARAALRERLDGIEGAARAPGHVLLGLIVGLIAAELDAEGRVSVG